MTPKELQTTLTHFTGTESYTHYNPQLFPKVVLTDGTKFLADEAGAYWLLDVISSYLPSVPEEEYFMIAWLQKFSDENGEHQASFQLMRDLDEDDPIGLCVEQHIKYTDFPLDEIKLYIQRDDEHWIILLPSEY